VNRARGGGLRRFAGARVRCARGLTSRTASRNNSLSGSLRLSLTLPPRWRIEYIARRCESSYPTTTVTRARGIIALREALKGLGDLTVVAPDRNRSGASNSLTLDVPLRVAKAEPDVYFVQGTPTDCVHLAISGLFPFEPDMVVSGINDGSNMGDHVLYSGTVAAATEGRFLGKPAVAVSLNTDDVRGDAKRLLRDGAHYARVIAERLLSTPLVLQMGRATILNVNVPNLPLEEVKGIRVTRLGNHHRSGAVIRAEDPRGRPVYGWALPVRGRTMVRAPISMP
jgi:5'-nucleotidase